MVRHFPARRSINGGDAVAGPARTIRSASRRMDSAFAPATSMTRSAAALRGPSPDGDQAAIVQSLVSGLARTARAIEPPISPKPRNAICMSASIAAAGPGGVDDRSVLPAASIGSLAGEGRLAATTPISSSVRAPTLRTLDCSALLALRVALDGRRPRIVRQVLAPDRHAALRSAAIQLHRRPATGTAKFVGGHRRQGRDRIDPAPAGPA